ncbi:MAG: hypothetical protein QOI29_4599 [Mycobacterium sp.]|nr:hypothetical protein [Mycobacterium sp.]
MAVHHTPDWTPDGATDADKLHFACGPDHKLLTDRHATTTVTDDGRLAWIIGEDPPDINHIHHDHELLDEEPPGDLLLPAKERVQTGERIADHHQHHRLHVTHLSIVQPQRIPAPVQRIGQLDDGLLAAFDEHAERRVLVDDLAGLESAAWETPSLCAGWAVRDVVAHLAATAALSRVCFAREFVLAKSSVERIVETQVALALDQDASASSAALQTVMNSFASPPLPLVTRIIEIVVHGEDIRRPLGLKHVYSTKLIADAVEYLSGDLASGGKKRLKGLTLEATDVDFSFGDKPLVTGSAVALLLTASGRSAALDELSGPSVSQLVSRILRA